MQLTEAATSSCRFPQPRQERANSFGVSPGQIKRRGTACRSAAHDLRGMREHERRLRNPMHRFEWAPVYSFLSLPFATGAYWELLALTMQDGRNPLTHKGKSHLFEGLSEGGGEPGGKMVCLPISPLPQGSVLQK